MRVCVFCSSSSEIDALYTTSARALGKLIAERGHELIYGGTRLGLMGIVADAAKREGGRVVGVITRSLAESGLMYREADEIILTEIIAERKTLMESLADAFIALPGGLGTLEELSQVLSLKQLHYLEGAVVLLNVSAFYTPLLGQLERIFNGRFAKPSLRSLYYEADTPEAAIAYIESYKAVRPLSK